MNNQCILCVFSYAIKRNVNPREIRNTGIPIYYYSFCPPNLFVAVIRSVSKMSYYMLFSPRYLK